MSTGNRRILFTLIPSLCIVLAINLYCVTPTRKQADTIPKKGVAVVELFTSEGCSSCPAADELVARLSEEYKEQLYVLGFHVDYWDRLGWRDQFSNASYSKRQNEYASILGLNSVYTPQAVVNGHAECVGSNESRLKGLIDDELKTTPGTPVELHATNKNNYTITVVYHTALTQNELVNIALVQSHTQTDVKKGENEGRVLHHVNIVRDLKTSTTGDGTITLTLPVNLMAKDCKVFAYIQNKDTYRITGASATSIE